MFAPIVSRLPDLSKEYNNDIKKIENEVLLGELPQPKLNLGFNYHYVSVKNRLNEPVVSIFEKKNKNKVNLTNPFETDIGEKNDISSFGNIVLGKDFNVNPNFYPLWEILYYFGLANVEKKGLTSLYITGDSSSVKLKEKYHPSFYFRKLNGSNKKDEYKTLHNKDLGKPKTKYNLIMSDALNYNKENELFNTLLRQVIHSVQSLKVGGSLVLQTLENYTNPTIKLITFLQLFFKSVYVIKPFTSNVMNVDRYIVCHKFVNNEYLYILEKILNETENGDINDILLGLGLPEDHRKLLSFVNTTLSGNNIGSINDYYSFIKSNNYFGDVFNKFREDQKKLNDYWVSVFYEKYNTVNSRLSTVIKTKIEATNKKSGL